MASKYIFSLLIVCVINTINAQSESMLFLGESNNLYSKFIGAAKINGNGWPSEWETPGNTGNFGYCLVEDFAQPSINLVPLEAGDFIGVFWADAQGVHHCGGAGEWTVDGVLFTIFGDDPFTPVKDGLSYNEVLKFKFFDWSRQKTYDIPQGNVSYMACPGCITSGKWNGFGIYNVSNIFINLSFDVVATADPDTICESGATQLVSEIWVGNGPYEYSWTSLPEGFVSNLQNPTFLIQESTDFIVTASNNSESSTHHVKVVVNNPPIVEAGINGMICASESFQITGDTAYSFSSISWTTSGDGTFNNPDNFHPIYFPGPQDMLLTDLKIFLTASPLQGCNYTVYDSLILNISQIAYINAGIDFAVCSTTPVQLNATATGFSSVYWSRTGSGTPGVFNNPSILNPIYTPSTYDLAIGVINFNVVVQPQSPCTASSNDQLKVTLQRNPSVNAGAGGIICATGSFIVHGSATYYNSIQWTSGGDGYFLNPTALNTTYIPGSQDRQGGIKVLTLTAIPNSPCTNPVTSSLNLVIIPSPGVNAGNDKTFSGNAPILLNGTASNYSSVQWISYGSGTFTNAGQLSTSYILSPEDLITDTIVIKLRANSMSPCTLPIYDSLFLINIDLITTTQTVTIPAGWSGISFYVHPTNQLIADIFAPIVDDLILAQNFNGMYWPSQGINTLVNWSENSGYQIKMTQQVELNLPGTFLINRTANFNEGWSFFPVLSECPISITGILGSFPQVYIVKEIAGNGVYWPGQNINTIGILNPGKSYMIKTSSNISITFPECENE